MDKNLKGPVKYVKVEREGDKEEYFYDEDGYLDSTHNQNADIVYSNKFFRDDNGWLTRVIQYNDGQLSEDVAFEYNEDHTQLVMDNGESTYKGKYKYDSEGRVIYEFQEFGNGYSIEKEFEYDADGRYTRTYLKFMLNEDATEVENIFEYGSEGEILKNISTASDQGLSSTETSVFTNHQFDDYGNVIAVKETIDEMHIKKHKVHIEYYD